MKALVYHGPGDKAWEEVPDPVVKDPTDVVVRVDTTTICGTDLHILQGDVAAVTKGRVLGHEAVWDRHRDRRRDRGLRRRRPGSRSGDHQVREVRVLPAQHALPLPDRGWNRLDLRPPHRRHSG